MKRRNAFSLVELLIVLAILAILISLILASIARARESARRTACSNRLRQIGLAVCLYESTHSRFPPGRLLPDWIRHGQPLHAYTNYGRVDQHAKNESTGFHSVHLRILPYLEANTLYQSIDLNAPATNRMTQNGKPDNVNYDALAQAQGAFICPSDPFTGRIISENNYRYNFGGSTPYGGAESTRRQRSHDVAVNGLPVLGNGAFSAGRRGLMSTSFVDGLAHTAFFSERTKGSGRSPARHPPDRSDVVVMPGREDGPIERGVIYDHCLAYQPRASRFNFMAAGRWLNGSDFSNGWPFASYSATMYNHVAAPNWSGQDCGNWSAIADTPGEHAIISARSRHRGVVNVCFGDAHVEVVSDSINLSVWRSLGSRNGRETSRQH